MEEQNWQDENQDQVAENVQMSEVGTLTGIFFEPGNTFLSFVTKPRFIVAGLLSIIALLTFQQLFQYKIGEERMTRYIAKEIEKSPYTQSMSAEEKKKAVEQQSKQSGYGIIILPIFMSIVFAIGGLIYWLAGNAMGGSGTFLKGLSVWIYSGFPPTILWAICNAIVLFLKSADEIDIGMSQRGVLTTSLGFLIDGKSMPVLATLLGTLDLFMIWGWFLAAIGLRIVCKISSGSAWAIVIILALVSIAFRVMGAYFGGNPL